MDDAGGKRIDWGHAAMRWQELVSSAQLEQAEFVRGLFDAGASRGEIEKNLGMRPSRMAAMMRILDAKYGHAGDRDADARELAEAVAGAVENESAMFDAAEAERARQWLHDVPVEDIALAVRKAAAGLVAFFRSRRATMPKKFQTQVEDAIFGAMTRARLGSRFMQAMIMRRLWMKKNAQREGD